MSATTLREVTEQSKSTFYESLNLLANKGVVRIDGTARSKVVSLTGTHHSYI